MRRNQSKLSIVDLLPFEVEFLLQIQCIFQLKILHLPQVTIVLQVFQLILMPFCTKVLKSYSPNKQLKNREIVGQQSIFFPFYESGLLSISIIEKS